MTQGVRLEPILLRQPTRLSIITELPKLVVFDGIMQPQGGRTRVGRSGEL